MYESLSKKAIGLMLVCEMLWGVVFTATLFAAKFILENENIMMPVYVYIGYAVTMALLVIAPFVRYHRYRYVFSEDEIVVREGFFWVSKQIVPIERLQKVALLSGPIDRIFGLTKVIVTTAGGDVTIRFLQMEKAENIVEKLKNRINQYVVETRGQEEKVL